MDALESVHETQELQTGFSLWDLLAQTLEMRFPGFCLAFSNNLHSDPINIVIRTLGELTVGLEAELSDRWIREEMSEHKLKVQKQQRFTSFKLFNPPGIDLIS